MRIRLEDETIEYFKHLSGETGLPDHGILGQVLFYILQAVYFFCVIHCIKDELWRQKYKIHLLKKFKKLYGY